jgi:hypothetical protein
MVAFKVQTPARVARLLCRDASILSLAAVSLRGARGAELADEYDGRNGYNGKGCDIAEPDSTLHFIGTFLATRAGLLGSKYGKGVLLCEN